VRVGPERLDRKHLHFEGGIDGGVPGTLTGISDLRYMRKTRIVRGLSQLENRSWCLLGVESPGHRVSKEKSEARWVTEGPGSTQDFGRTSGVTPKELRDIDSLT